MNKIHTPEKSEKTEMLSGEDFSLPGKSLHLSIEVREKEVLACLLDKHSNRYVAWKKFKRDAKNGSLEELLKDELLSVNAAGISVVFTQNSSILVPAPLFKKELLSDYLSLQQLNKVNETPCFDPVKTLDSYNLYTVNKDTLDSIRKKIPNASLYHSSTIFVEFILIENKHTKDNIVFVYAFNAFMDIIVLKEGKLTLSNRFYYSNSNDFIYYLLWVYEQLGLDNEKVPCVFYGDIETSSEPFIIADKYIKQVSLGKSNKQLTYSPNLASLPPHKYRSLFTQYLCV